jgi:hypothetical protein
MFYFVVKNKLDKMGSLTVFHPITNSIKFPIFTANKTIKI